MPDLALAPVTPLGGTSPRVDHIGAITITEVLDLALVSVARRSCPTEAFEGPMQELLGNSLPGPNEGTRGAVGAFWTGPGQWMLHARGPEQAMLANRVKAAMGGAASVTDQSDGWCAFAIEGPGAVEMFARLCPLDIATMTPGAASRTSIEHLGCFVLCDAVRTCFTVLGPRSAAASLHHALTIAAHSIA